MVVPEKQRPYYDNSDAELDSLGQNADGLDDDANFDRTSLYGTLGNRLRGGGGGPADGAKGARERIKTKNLWRMSSERR